LGRLEDHFYQFAEDIGHIKAVLGIKDEAKATKDTKQ
jgi:hypothetical protein